jgi:hypothetical protein
VKKVLEDKGTKVAFLSSKKQNKVNNKRIVQIIVSFILNMSIERVLHMKGGVGETSYANNSLLQVFSSFFIVNFLLDNLLYLSSALPLPKVALYVADFHLYICIICCTNV